MVWRIQTAANKQPICLQQLLAVLDCRLIYYFFRIISGVGKGMLVTIISMYSRYIKHCWVDLSILMRMVGMGFNHRTAMHYFLYLIVLHPYYQLEGAHFFLPLRVNYKFLEWNLTKRPRIFTSYKVHIWEVGLPNDLT